MMGGRRNLDFRVWGLIISIAVFLVLVSVVVEFTLDEAFVSYRYAANFAAGKGLVFNAGDRVEGYTNFLWVILLSAGSYLHLSLPMIGKSLGIGFAGATILVVYRLAAELTFGGWIGFGSCLMLSSQPLFISAAVSGMETAMFTFLTCASALVYLREFRDPNRPPYSSSLFLATALTRPDGVLNFAAVCVHRLAQRTRILLHLGNETRRVLWFAIPGLIYFAWRWAYYDSFWPNTFLAKGMATTLLWTRGFGRFFEFVRILGIWPIALWLVGLWIRDPIRDFLSFLLVARLLFAISSGGDWNNTYRFFVPALPLLYLCAFSSAVELGKRMPSVSSQARRFIYAFLLIATVGWHAYQAQAHVFPGLHRYAHGLTQAHIAFGQWLRHNAPPGSSIALEDIGAIPFYSGLTTIDLLGLTDRHIASLPGDFFDKTDPAYVISSAPTFIVLISQRGDSYSTGLPGMKRLFEEMSRSGLYKCIGTAVFIPNFYYLWIYARVRDS